MNEAISLAGIASLLLLLLRKKRNGKFQDFLENIKSVEEFLEEARRDPDLEPLVRVFIDYYRFLDTWKDEEYRMILVEPTQFQNLRFKSENEFLLVFNFYCNFIYYSGRHIVKNFWEKLLNEDITISCNYKIQLPSKIIEKGIARYKLEIKEMKNFDFRAGIDPQYKDKTIEDWLTKIKFSILPIEKDVTHIVVKEGMPYLSHEMADEKIKKQLAKLYSDIACEIRRKMFEIFLKTKQETDKNDRIKIKWLHIKNFLLVICERYLYYSS